MPMPTDPGSLFTAPCGCQFWTEGGGAIVNILPCWDGCPEFQWMKAQAAAGGVPVEDPADLN